MDRSIPLTDGWPRGVSPEVVRLDGLATEARDGSRAAFDELTELLLDEIYTFVAAQCESEEDGEEVVSQVFAKAWRSAQSYKSGSGKYREWLYAIARNAVRDYRKRKQRERHAALPPLLRLARRLRPLTPPPESKLQTMLDRLTQPQREVVILRFYDQKSFAEIGELIGKREGTARALLHRAMRRLDECLGDE